MEIVVNEVVTLYSLIFFCQDIYMLNSVKVCLYKAHKEVENKDFFQLFHDLLEFL